MSGNFNNVNQILTIKRTVGLHFFVGEIKSTGKYATIFGKYEGNIFPSEVMPSTVCFTGIQNGHGVHIVYKMVTITATKLTKSDKTQT